MSRIVDQVVEQKMDFIQSKVEEILYHYVGIEKPARKEKLDMLVVKTDLLPPLDDLEQVSPDSDKKSNVSEDALNESKGDDIEEEIVDEEFESPAFEPIESILLEKNDNSHHSNLSAISGLTSQDSLEDKPEPPVIEEQQHSEMPSTDLQQDSQLSQISSLQDMSQEATKSIPVSINEEAQMPSSSTAQAEHNEYMASASEEVKIDTEAVTAECPDEPMDETQQPEKSQFDLNKDAIEFTGTERKTQPLDDSMPPTDTEKVLQPQDVPSNTMEIDNLYENETDSSEMRMEIDLKDETTFSVQHVSESSKVEESSQDSTISKEKSKSEPKKDSHHHSHHKSDRSRDKHKSSSSHKSSHHHRSSSSRSKHKRSSSDKHRSSSGRREHDKKSSKDDSKRHHRDNKVDDHHQEKSSSTRKRRSTDHDSNEGKEAKPASGGAKPETVTRVESPQKRQESGEKPVVEDNPPTESTEIAGDSKSSTPSAKKELKSSILVKYDYLKSKPPGNDIEDGCIGFDVTEDLPSNPWFECLRKDALKGSGKKKVIRRPSNSNYLDKKSDASLNLSLTKTKAKAKVKTASGELSVQEAGNDGAAKMSNGSEETKVQSVLQQQRYDTEELYKPRMDYGNRNRRRGRTSEDVPVEEVKEPQAERAAE